MLLIQLLINGLIKGGIYALMALGFALVYRGAKVFHIAHGAIYIVGAYCLYFFNNLLHLPFFASALFSIFIVILSGTLCEVLVYSPLAKRNASTPVIIISSLSIYIILVNIIALLFGNETQILFKEISESYTIGSIIVTETQVFQLIFSIIPVIAVVMLLNITKLGISLKALANNPTLSLALGFDIKKLRIILFGLSSLLAGVAAILVSSDVGVDPWGGLGMLLSGAVAMIIGGIKRWQGPILGGFFLGIIQALAIWQLSARWQDVITFVLLIIFLLFRPQGILGMKLRMEEV